MQRILRLTLVVAVVAAGLGGMVRPAHAQQGKTPVAFSAALSKRELSGGASGEVTVTARIQPGYHIYSVVPVPPPGPQETKLTVEGAGIATAGDVTESAPKRVNDANFGKELGLHEETATFTQPFTVAADAQPGKLPLTVKVRYMACTDSACLPPKTVTVPVPELTVAAGTGATAASKPAPPRRRGPVTFAAALSHPTVRPGEAVAVTVTAKVMAPFHIYSRVPVPAPGPKETKLTVEGEGITAVGEGSESAPEQINDPNFGKVIGMHKGTATFTQVVEVAPDATPGKALPLTVKVRYMACDDSACLPPKTETLEVPALQVEAGAARPEFRKEAIAAAVNTPPGGSGDGAGGSGEVGSPAKPAAPAAAAKGGLGPFLLAAFGAGLLALITPCVFPMIPVTLAFFTKQAAAKGEEGAAARASVVRLAATYSLGIVAAFTGIGAVMAATVGAAGANRLAANPWVNLAFAVLFVIFALSLLEVMELRPPAALQKLSMGGRNTGGTLGVLFMGLTFVIAAFTCTAPFIGTVLVAAASAQTGEQWVRPILGMAAFATALALPFFLLALFPALLAKMPRSGAWLSTVKGAMGFVELAAALKFLSNADLVWQWQLLTQPVLLALWALVAAAGAFWLGGALKIGFGAPEGRLTPARGIWTGVYAAAAVYCLYALTGRPINPLVASILPPPDYGHGALAAARQDGEGKLEWLPTLEEGLAKAKAENKPLFIDFTGYTCTNCRWVEQNVFVKPEVQENLQRYVLVRLYTDDKNEAIATKRQEYQEKTFGTVALPLYAVLDANGKPLRQGDVDFFGGALDPLRFTRNFVPFLQQGTVPAGANAETVAQK